MTQFPKKSLRILIKAIVLFVIFNYAFIFVPDSVLWRVSLYNTLIPGKTRFLLETNLEKIFSAHEIASSPLRSNEYKVFILGDSSVWGDKLNPNETFSSVINAARIPACNGKTIHVYNLGYPVPLVLKDMLILQRALPYQPDLVLWNVTLLSMLENKKDIKGNVIIRNNPEAANNLMNQYGLINGIGALPKTTPQNQTFLDQRDSIARFIKTQLDDIRWGATGGEQVDKAYDPLGMDVSGDSEFKKYNLFPPTLNPNLMHFAVLSAGIKMAAPVPVIIINEPIQIVTGENSDIRYNKMYPRWVYDQYRDMMQGRSAQAGWQYVDLWNVVPGSQFTNTTFHHTAKGEKILAQAIQALILKNACP